MEHTINPTTTLSKITLLALNDFHSSHRPQKITFTDGSVKILGGSERIARCIQGERDLARENNGSVLCLDAGDQFLGSDYFTFFNGGVEMELLETMRVSAMTVGNHDFDQGGLENLLKQHKKAPNLSLLSANIVRENGDRVFEPFKVFQCQGAVVGVVGLIGPDAWRAIPFSARTGLRHLDMADSSIAAVKEMKASHPNIDLLVCLSHTGESGGDVELAQTGLFDAIFSGHEHFPNQVREWRKILTSNPEKPVCFLHPGNCEGRAISKLTFSPQKTEEELRIYVETIPIDSKFDIGVDSPSEMEKKVTQMLKEHDRQLEKLSGEALAFCHNDTYTLDYLKKDFCPNTLKPLSNLVLDAYLAAFHRSVNGSAFDITPEKLVAVINFGGLRGSFPQGKITMGDVCGIHPFNDMLEIIHLKGFHLNKFKEKNEQKGHFHFKWMVERPTGLEIAEEEHNETFFLLVSNYLRENEVISVLDDTHYEHPQLSDIVVWTMRDAEYPEGYSPQGVRDLLVYSLRETKELH